MEPVLTQTKSAWRQLAEDPGLDDLDVLRQGIIHQVMFSAAHTAPMAPLVNHGAQPRDERLADLT
ncbi:hypothetical protein ABT121_35710 [Streptomyces sp. NPDC001928]|uniref:hypothetical protein n=1 Tax=Streptomyces sp. NPDC001928 TaxID=3154404 RepID=UPI003321413E